MLLHYRSKCSLQYKVKVHTNCICTRVKLLRQRHRHTHAHTGENRFNGIIFQMKFKMVRVEGTNFGRRMTILDKLNSTTSRKHTILKWFCFPARLIIVILIKSILPLVICMKKNCGKDNSYSGRLKQTKMNQEDEWSTQLKWKFILVFLANETQLICT